MVVCMKKILLFATFALLNVGLGFAELHETFDGGVFPPEGWTTTCKPSTLNDHPQWSSTDDINQFIFGYSTGGYAAYSKAGGFGEGLETDSWLVTPRVTVESGQYLHFMLGANWATNVAENERAFEVLVSQSDTERANFTDTLMCISPQGVLPWGAYALDLSKYADKSVYIAFHERGHGGYSFVFNSTYVDDVAIDAYAGPDVAIHEVLAMGNACDTEQPIQVKVVNTGLPVSSYRLNYRVGDGETVSETVAEPLLSGESRTYQFARKALCVTGETSVITAWVDGVSNDLNLENDTLETEVEMRPSIDYPYQMTSENITTDFSSSSTPSMRAAYWAYSPENEAWVWVPYNGKTALLRSNCIPLPAGPIRVEFEYMSSYDFTMTVKTGYFVTNEYVTVGVSDNLPASETEFVKGSVTCNIAEAGLVSLALQCNSLAQVAVRNIKIKDPYEDIVAEQITSPKLSARLVDGAVKVSAIFKNNGKSAQSHIPVYFQVNDGEVVSGEIDALAANESKEYTFPTTADWSTPGEKVLKVWSAMSGDGDLSNDTLTTRVQAYTARPFPHNMGFNEDSSDVIYWSSYNPDQDGVYWEPILKAAAGLPKEGTGIGYIDSYAGITHNDWYISPAISMPKGKARISFYYATVYSTGESSLKVYMGRSDDPDSLTTLLCSYPVDKVNQYRCGYAQFDIPEAGNYYFAFYNEGTGRNIILDDVRIDAAEDVAMSSVELDCADGFNLSEAAVTVQVVNLGVSPQENLTFSYEMNGNGSPVSEIYEGPLAPGDTVTYTFTQKADVSAVGTYTFRSYVKSTVDTDSYNDTLPGASLKHWANATIPYKENFEDATTDPYWSLKTLSGASLVITHSAFSSSSAYDGTGLLGSSGQTAADVDAWARSQCIDIPAGEYEFSMFYRTMMNQPASPNTTLSYVQRFRVYLSADPDDMTDAILLYDNDSVIVKEKHYAKLSVPVTVDKDGAYYIVINCYSPKGNGCLYLDDIELSPVAEAGTTLPYHSDFESNEGEWYHYSPASNIEQWSAVTEGGETFMQTQYFYDYGMESKGIAGLYVAPSVALSQGDSVRVTIDYEIMIDDPASDHGQNLTVYMADKDVPDAYTTQVVCGDVIDDRSQVSGVVAIPKDGIYYFGVKPYCPQETSATQMRLFAFDMERVNTVSGIESTESQSSFYFDGERLHILGDYIEVTLYDCRGAATGSYRDESVIDLSNLSSGVYIVRLLTGTRVVTGKIMVQ